MYADERLCLRISAQELQAALWLHCPGVAREKHILQSLASLLSRTPQGCGAEPFRALEKLHGLTLTSCWEFSTSSVTCCPAPNCDDAPDAIRVAGLGGGLPVDRATLSMPHHTCRSQHHNILRSV
jgi:hypothetical protein